ncbi:MAG: helix-turn-helix domain-containing protein [Nitrospirota bacterium]
MNNKEKLALFRLNYIDKVKNRSNGIKIADACKRLGISFPTYYKWRRRLLEAGKDSITALLDRRPSGKKHYKSLTHEHEEAIIEVILKHPEYGSQRISAALRENKGGKPYVSNGGVQKFLERRGLNLMRDRIKFAEEYFKSINAPSKKDRNLFIVKGSEEEFAASGMVVNA